MHYAVLYCHNPDSKVGMRIIQLLLEHGASAGAKNDNDATPLHFVGVRDYASTLAETGAGGGGGSQLVIEEVNTALRQLLLERGGKDMLRVKARSGLWQGLLTPEEVGVQIKAVLDSLYCTHCTALTILHSLYCTHCTAPTIGGCADQGAQCETNADGSTD
jgi:hypothetical protein